MKRRSFLKGAALIPAVMSAAQADAEAKAQGASDLPRGRYRPGSIINDYNTFLPGEREALRISPKVSFEIKWSLNAWELFSSVAADWKVAARLGSESKTLKVGDSIGGWRLVAIVPYQNGVPISVSAHANSQSQMLAFSICTCKQPIRRVLAFSICTCRQPIASACIQYLHMQTADRECLHSVSAHANSRSRM